MLNQIKALRNIFFAVSSVFLAGCGGGGGSSQNGGTAEVMPTPTSTPSPTSTPVVVSLFDVAGRISIAANTLSDTDTNDPFSDLIDNSTLATAQRIDNIAVINGFLTKNGTGIASDVFAFESDEDDFYRVALQAGQTIRLQVVDSLSFVGANFSGDLDMDLFDLDANLIASSTSQTEFEEITVINDGEYYLRIYAFSGTSKYVADLASEFLSERLNRSFDKNIYLENMRVGEAILIDKPALAASRKPTVDSPNKSKATADNNTAANTVATAPSASTERAEPLGRETLVKFDVTQSLALKTSASNLQAKTKVYTRNQFKQELALLNPEALEKVDTIGHIKRLRVSNSYEYVSPNFIRSFARMPNDISYPRQWHYPAINLPQAWDISTGQSTEGDVIVAVVDTGIFLSHPELDNQLIAGYDFISDIDNAIDGDGIDNDPDDPGDSSALGQSSWHGTHVAGTIAAESNNISGVAGVSWSAKLMPLRVLGASGGSSYDIIQALRYAAGLENDSGTVPVQRADIINLSLGGPGSSAAENSFYQSLYDMGIIVVAAAGNESSNRAFYPAAYDGVFSVSATDAVGNLAPYSNFGATVDLAAPGGDLSRDRDGDGRGDGILSTSVDDASGVRQPAYSFQSGTSMAAPHVAGVFALMKAVHPLLTATELDTLLRTGSLNSSGNTAHSDSFGYGIIDALAAVQAAQRLANGENPPELPASMVATPRNANVAANNRFDFSIANRGGGAVRVTEILSSQPWLSATSLDIDNNGLGTYRFSVSREDLIDGTYLAQTTFKFDGASDLNINVSMSVGESIELGQSSQLFVILVDELTQQTADTVLARSDASGNLSYRFDNVPEGDYTIYIGSDVDNDDLLCQYGEACGAYPTVNQIRPRRIDSDISDLNLLVDIFSNIGGANASVSTGASGLTGGLGVKKKPVRKVIEP